MHVGARATSKDSPMTRPSNSPGFSSPRSSRLPSPLRPISLVVAAALGLSGAALAEPVPAPAAAPTPAAARPAPSARSGMPASRRSILNGRALPGPYSPSETPPSGWNQGTGGLGARSDPGQSRGTGQRRSSVPPLRFCGESFSLPRNLPSPACVLLEAALLHGKRIRIIVLGK